MSRGLRFVRVLIGVTAALELFACGGGNSTPQPPPACQNTATTKCTQSGALQGFALGGLYAFRGIPYTAPPVGNLRWKAPQPPASWSGVRDASSFGNVCPQINFGGQLVGDEDCLTLNVYVSQNPPNQKQPVMVSLHGGSNSQGDQTLPPADMPLLAL